MINITRKEAREFILKYQNIYNPRQLKSDDEIINFIQKVGCIQYDPLSKIAKNADLVLQSRCKNYSEKTLYRLLYEKRALLDGWDKNMSIWSVNDWPYFSRKRKAFKSRYKSRVAEFKSVKNEIKKKIEKYGYINSKDVSGNKKVNWSWAPTDIGRASLESMYHCGELVIHHKEGTRKFYGFTKNILPKRIINKQDPNAKIDDYHEWYVKRRIGSIGLLWNRSGDSWLGSKLKKGDRSNAIEKLLKKDEIEHVKIDDIDELCYLAKKDIKILDDTKVYNEASMIAPLDNLIWDRRFISRIFNFDYKWEVYTPVKDRKFGYYVLPVIYQEKFIGRCEPIIDRKNNELILMNWWWEKEIKQNSDMTRALIKCFKDFAKFLNIKKISISGNIKNNEFKWIQNCV